MQNFNKLATSFITKKGVSKIKCHNEVKPIKILGVIEEEDGLICVEVDNGQAIWVGDKWAYRSNFERLSGVIMKKDLNGVYTSLNVLLSFIGVNWDTHKISFIEEESFPSEPANIVIVKYGGTGKLMVGIESLEHMDDEGYLVPSFEIESLKVEQVKWIIEQINLGEYQIWN